MLFVLSAMGWEMAPQSLHHYHNEYREFQWPSQQGLQTVELKFLAGTTRRGQPLQRHRT